MTMFRQNMYDAGGPSENCNNLSPNNIYNCLAVSHSQNAVYTTPTRSTFKRYSLADAWQTPSPTQQNKIQSEIHYSAKIDSDSPGYSTRVVQYSEERGKPLPTHLYKHDKLGVFPIVHFFKKELPFLKRKSINVHCPTNSSDISKFNSPDHHRLLLETIIKPSPGSQETVSHHSESNTKSVLDALKEISGKRIHTDGGEFILKEDGKRIYVDYDNENNLSKRVKQTQIEDFTRATSPVRTVGLLNELMASCSSMDGCSNEKSKKMKPNGHTNTHLKSFTPSKYVDVETQTSESQIPSISETISDSKETSKQDVNLNLTRPEFTVKKVSPVKIFDETPLEIMRKNRLTALMGSLIAHKENSKAEPNVQQVEDTSVLDKPLISILAGNTRNLHKSTKHVHFDIPDVVKSDHRNNANSVMASKDFLNIRAQTDVTKTSTAITSPIISASITKSVSPQKLAKPKMNDTSTLPNSTLAVVDQNQKNSSSVHLHTALPSSQVISNTVASPSTRTQNLIFRTNTVDNDVSEKNNVNPSTIKADDEVKSSKAMIDNNPVTEVNGIEFPAAGTSRAAGFKFELKDATAVKTLAMPALFTFTTPPTSTNTKSTVTSNPEIINVFSDTGINQSFGISSVGPFSINKDQAISKSSDVGVSLLSSNTFEQSVIISQACNTFTANSSINTATPNFNVCSAPTSKPTSFGFVSSIPSTTTVATNITPSPFRSGNSTLKLFDSTIATKNPSTLSLANTPIPLSFNVQTNTSSITSPFSSSSKGIVTSNSSTSTTFCKSTNRESMKSTNNFFFTGSDSSFTNNSSLINNENSTPTNFGAGGSTKAMFGQVSTTLFGTTTPSSFGSSIGNTLGSNAFENAKTTTNSAFNTTSNRNTSNVSAFGANTNSNFAPNNFGIKQKSNLSGNLNDFKHNTTPPFASPFNNTFGVSTNTTGASKSFDSNRCFGETNSIASISSFGNSSAFEKSTGVNTTETPPFGNTNFTYGSTNFTANRQKSQNAVFTFGSNKPAVFSFGTSEAPKTPLNFQTETNASIFGNKGLSSDAPSSFNSSTNSQFNVQPTGGHMFNIGIGNSTPSRLRAQHKAKRRT